MLLELLWESVFRFHDVVLKHTTAGVLFNLPAPAAFEVQGSLFGDFYVKL